MGVAVLPTPTRPRRLADANAACAREAEALDECTYQSISESAGPWADCVVAAYLDSHAATPAGAVAAGANSNAAAGDEETCDALRAYLCSPVDSCPALASCVDKYNPYADCLVTAEQEGLALLCDVSCGSSSSSVGSNGTDGSSESNESRLEPSESTSSAFMTGARMIGAFVVAVGLAAHAYS